MQEKANNVRKNVTILEEGSFWDLLLKLALPSVVVILIMLIYNMADTFFIGQTGDPNKISAISISMPIFTILSGIGTLFGNGGATSVSIALGEGDYDKIRKITSFCLAGALVVGIAFWAVTFFFASPLALVLGANEETLDFTIEYVRVFAFAAPLVLFTNSFGNILRSDGEAASAMVANICGSLSNIVLDALFIMVFHWDVFGAAFATVLGNVFSTIIMIRILATRKQSFLPGVQFLTLQRDISIPVLTRGLPMMFSTSLGSISHVFSNRIMISFSSIALAAQSVAGKLNMMITMLVMGICMGLMPAISYNYGKKNYKRMNQILKQTGLFSVALGLVLTLIIFLTKDQLVAAFIRNDEVIAYGRVFVMASVIIGPVYGIFQICQAFLQGTGKVSYAILISLMDKGLIYIPVLFIMGHLFDAYGVAFSHAVTMIPCLIIAVSLALKWNRDITR